MQIVAVTFAIVLALRAPVATAQDFQIDAAQFDQWIFQNMQSSENARRLLADRIEMELHRIAISTELREEQKARIRLAAKGDIKRFFDEVAEAHRQFEKLRGEGEINQNNINEIYQLATPLQQQLNSGLFGRDSLMHKVSREGVDQHQADELKRREREMHARQTRSLINYVIATIGRQVPLLHEQREKLTQMLGENIEIQDPNSQYASMTVMYYFSEIPREKLKAILDERQMTAIEKQLDQAAAMKATLIQMGVINE